MRPACAVTLRTTSPATSSSLEKLVTSVPTRPRTAAMFANIVALLPTLAPVPTVTPLPKPKKLRPTCAPARSTVRAETVDAARDVALDVHVLGERDDVPVTLPRTLRLRRTRSNRR